jgi:hypothetical protein
MELEKAITEAILIWRAFWRPPIDDNLKLVQSWVMLMQGVNVEAFKRAANEIVNESQYWPTPKQILDKINGSAEPLPAYYREFKPLPMPDEPPITPEQKKEILAGMSEGGRRMFLTVIYGDEQGKVPRKEA